MWEEGNLLDTFVGSGVRGLVAGGGANILRIENVGARSLFLGSGTSEVSNLTKVITPCQLINSSLGIMQIAISLFKLRTKLGVLLLALQVMSKQLLVSAMAHSPLKERTQDEEENRGQRTNKPDRQQPLGTEHDDGEGDGCSEGENDCDNEIANLCQGDVVGLDVHKKNLLF